MSVHIDDIREYDEDAPRPIDPSLVDEGTFEKLDEGQGAVTQSSHVTSAKSERLVDALPVSKRTLIVMLVIVLAVVLGAVVITVRILDIANSRGSNAAVVEQTWVPADGEIAYRGSTYSLAKKDNGYVLLETHENSSGKPTTLGELHGTPVALVLYNGAFIIPENLSDGTWGIAAYTIGSGWSKLVSHDGEEQGGTGSISEAKLQGSNVLLVVDGKTVEVPLSW